MGFLFTFVTTVSNREHNKLSQQYEPNFRTLNSSFYPRQTLRDEFQNIDL